MSLLLVLSDNNPSVDDDNPCLSLSLLGKLSLLLPNIEECEMLEQEVTAIPLGCLSAWLILLPYSLSFKFWTKDTS